MMVKHLVNKIIELIKFSLIVGLLALLAMKAPNEAAQIVAVAGAYLAGKFQTEKSKSTLI